MGFIDKYGDQKETMPLDFYNGVIRFNLIEVDVTNWSIYINTWEREEQTTDEPILASPKLKCTRSMHFNSNSIAVS